MADKSSDQNLDEASVDGEKDENGTPKAISELESAFRSRHRPGSGAVAGEKKTGTATTTTTKNTSSNNSKKKESSGTTKK